MEGNAHTFEPIVVGKKNTKEWIDSKAYLKSPLIFAAPPRIMEQWVPLHYAVKDARLWYDKKLRSKVENYLRKYEITFFVDMDPKDWSKVKLF